MSWYIHAIGDYDAVKRAVEQASEPGNPAQMELAKQIIMQEIDRMPRRNPNHNGVEIEASGHHDSNHMSGSRNLKIEVKSIQLHRDEVRENVETK